MIEEPRTEVPTVFVVEDDEQARASVCAMVRSHGLTVQSFASAEELLDVLQEDRPGCVVTDLRLEGQTGLELQEELIRRGRQIPVIVLTGFAHTPITVRAMRNGAVTLLDKPYRDDELWQAIQQALEIDVQRRTRHARQQEIRSRLQLLTPSERQVLRLIIDGIPNKTIAQRLDVSERTVESRRHEIFSKMEAHSLAELVRKVMEAGEE